jgi:ABC-type nitrate/sulfonate/bicarbonate transport system substrate-binding protein
MNRLALFVLLLTGIVAAQLASAQERVRMALSVRNVVFLPFYFAKDTRIFDKHNLNVELIQMRSDLQMAGLVSGEIDYTPAIGPATFSVANGAPIKGVAVLYRAPLFSLVSPPSIANAKELEGKKVAVSRIGSDSHRFGSQMLEIGGADPKKVTFIQTGNTTVSLTSLQQGVVNGAVLSPPFTGIVAEKGFRVLVRSRQLIDSPWLGLVANKTKLDKQPEQARNVLRSMRDVIAAIRRDKPGVVNYIVKNFSVSVANATESYEDIAGVLIDSMTMRDEQMQKYLDGFHQRGELLKAVSVNEMFDFSMLRSLK